MENKPFLERLLGYPVAPWEVIATRIVLWIAVPGLSFWGLVELFRWWVE